MCVYIHIYYLMSFCPQHSIEGLLFCWPWSFLLSLLDFLFLDPLSKTATLVFVRTPLDIRKYWTFLFSFLIQMMGNRQNCIFCLFFAPPGRRLLLTPGMGMWVGGGGPLGTIWDNFTTIVSPFWINFRTPIMPPLPPHPHKQKTHQPEIYFLEMAYSNFVSSIR